MTTLEVTVDAGMGHQDLDALGRFNAAFEAARRSTPTQTNRDKVIAEELLAWIDQRLAG